jgi:hypothetical protein
MTHLRRVQIIINLSPAVSNRGRLQQHDLRDWPAGYPGSGTHPVIAFDRRRPATPSSRGVQGTRSGSDEVVWPSSLQPVRWRLPPTGLPAIKCSASMVWSKSCTVFGRHNERPPGVGTLSPFNTSQISRSLAPLFRSLTTHSRISSGQCLGRPGRRCGVLGNVVISAAATGKGKADH